MSEPENRAPVARDEKGRVVAGGGSLNPGGKPKVVAEVMEKLEKGLPAAADELVRLATSAESEKVRVAAITALFDRVCGKPQVSVNVDGPGLTPAAAALLELVAANKAKREGGT